MSDGPKFRTAAQAGLYVFDLALTAAVDQLHRELGQPRTCEPDSRDKFRAAHAGGAAPEVSAPRKPPNMRKTYTTNHAQSKALIRRRGR